MCVMTNQKKFLRVTMPNGDTYDIPVKIIAENRAKYYAEYFKRRHIDYDKTYQEELSFTLENDYELLDWANSNMDWDDVKDHAIKVEKEPIPIDFEESWLNGEKEIITREVEANG